jgi:hypothetical protein
LRWLPFKVMLRRQVMRWASTCFRKLWARKERLTLETLRADLQASAA